MKRQVVEPKFAKPNFAELQFVNLKENTLVGRFLFGLAHSGLTRARTFTLVVLLVVLSSPTLFADSSEAAIAAYADAANFQTNGAYDLAIEGWKEFLEKHGDDEMAPKAAHYLGVCYMQKDSPDYVAAANAFEKALENKEYDLREESLANQGWCLYASAGDGPQRDQERLRATIKVYATLQREKPNSQFLDRALFYSGEASYGLGDRKQAVGFYDKLLALPTAKDSPLRCDALYARGIAHEELDQFDAALASFQQLLSSCATDDLATDVNLRIGDVMIFRKKYDTAIKSFEAAIESAKEDDDKSYAIFRQAFALIQAERPADAAKKYDQLQKEFPKSKYAATAMLASAQSTYRSGNLDAAAKKFGEVLKQRTGAPATEAAHWLARIYITKGNPAQAVKVAQQQIKAGAQGEYAVDLKMDLAEAMSLDPKTVAKSIAIAEQIYRDAPRDDLAPRALYNAAFSALQINEPAKALSLAKEFLAKFPKDTLLPDVQFIAAEGQLLTGKTEEAAKSYDQLLRRTSPDDNVQRPLWVLRAATTSNAARDYETTIGVLRREYNTIKLPAQKAEAQMLIGHAYMMSKRHSDAALAFKRCQEADPKWARADEAQLLSGTALFAAGKRDEAISAWKTLISRSGKSRMADQARYKLAQIASSSRDHGTAVKLYDEIITSKLDPGLLPYALYGKGWALMQDDKHDQAVAPLNEVLAKFKSHAVGDDALLARGITLRNLDRFEDASVDLAEYLTLKPTGTNLGHALYEMALIDQKQKQPGKAATRLQRLVSEVPKYPAMDKVLYELGWSLRESGDEDKAEKQFMELVRRYPNAPTAGEAAYFIGQKSYAAGNWKQAAKQFDVAAKKAADKDLSEKAHYRLGWSYFKTGDYANAEKAFAEQARKHSTGKLSLDAMMMVGECQFKQSKFKTALAAYTVARERIRQNNENGKTIRDPAERQVRELVLLHGGQSAAQEKKWDEAIDWYEELRERFPSTRYLPQVFYESGFAYQQKKDSQRALKVFAEVADNYRNEVAARARFMMGEIYFGQRQFDKAIPEFQRVMYGFGAEKASDAIKNWQAKSGFEAGRCSELLMQQAKSEAGRRKSRDYASKFFQYVIDKHPNHELVMKSTERLEALK